MWPPRSTILMVQEFFLLIPEDSKPDYLTIHIYTTTFDSFVSRVEEYWNEFQLPIIVSEFAMQVTLLRLLLD